jgi:hypothetical protein
MTFLIFNDKYLVENSNSNFKIYFIKDFHISSENYLQLPDFNFNEPSLATNEYMNKDYLFYT